MKELLYQNFPEKTIEMQVKELKEKKGYDETRVSLRDTQVVPRIKYGAEGAALFVIPAKAPQSCHSCASRNLVIPVEAPQSCHSCASRNLKLLWENNTLKGRISIKQN